MWKYTAKVEGMMCGMCEAHVNDAVRKQFNVEKVTASHKKNTVEIICEAELDEAAVKECIEGTGYDFKGITKEPYKKKGLFGIFGK